MAALKSISITGAVADPDGIALTQTPSSSITINGVFASGGVATLTPAGRVSVTSGGDISNRTITIVGTDRNGNAQTSTITGPNNTTVYTNQDYKTITSATISGLAAAAITVGTNGVASTPWYCGDYMTGKIPILMISLSAGAVLTYTVESTPTNLNGGCADITAQIQQAQNPIVFASTDTDVVGASASQQTNYINGMPGMRVTLNTYTSGTLTISFVTADNSTA